MNIFEIKVWKTETKNRSSNDEKVSHIEQEMILAIAF